MSEPLAHVEGLTKVFDLGGPLWNRTKLTAVKDVDLQIHAGETVGVVGESGSGKSTLLRLILGLIRPTSGRILFNGRDLWAMSRAERLELRRQMQAVFQDTASTFNPRYRLKASLLAPLEVHRIGDRRTRLERIVECLEMVGLDESFLTRHPHQLSGGQRQRVAIARAILLQPSFVLADEPTSALDVSIQAQILNLFQKTKRELALTYLFVSHNLAVIRYICDRVIVMHLGEIVEAGPVEEIFEAPQHDYTKRLLAAVPEPDPTCRQWRMQPPGPVNAAQAGR
jgi:ABC-type oligopeptide transport system ATPase subunit